MKVEQIAKTIVITLILLFLGLYLTQSSSYNEFEQRRKTALTNEQIKRFEQDVKDGKQIDVEKYLKENEKDYSNKVSDFTLATSKKIEQAFHSGLEYFFKKIEGVTKPSD